jgi:hypothetical protein
MIIAGVGLLAASGSVLHLAQAQQQAGTVER